MEIFNIFIIFIIFIVLVIVNIKYPFEKFNNRIERIPKIIIQTWKDNNIPNKYYKDINSVITVNKNFKRFFFTDNDIDLFLKTYYPEYYLTYLKLPLIIQKIDFFRYVAIYHYGGFYFDLDMNAMYPLDELINYKVVFPIEQIVSTCNNNRWKNLCSRNINTVVGNYAFGAEPKNEFIKLLIENIHKNIDIIIKNKNNSNNYVYETTGPDYVSFIYNTYNKKNNVTLLKNCKSNRHLFGKFAKHNYYGTWKTRIKK